jgi:two-component system response regulator QseB
VGRPRLLLVEDDARLGPIIADVLAPRWQVELTADGESGLRAALERHHDVLVVDRRLPGMSGTELVAELRRRRMAVPVIMLTALGELRDRVSGLDAGADDYLVKPFEFEELEARLRALVRDHGGPGDAVEIGSWTYWPEDASVQSPYTGRVMLTEKENELLRLLASAPDRTFSRQHLLASVFEHGEQLGTVDTYVHYVRRKTDRDLITTVRGVGYRLGTPA